jgi:hypothetical protein
MRGRSDRVFSSRKGFVLDDEVEGNGGYRGILSPSERGTDTYQGKEDCDKAFNFFQLFPFIAG